MTFRGALGRPAGDRDQPRQNWQELITRYLQRAGIPFSIDPETLQRDDRPPDYIAFREGLINLLIHQDYADHTRKPVIRSFDDCVLLWNPGDAFVSADELLDPGDKEVRNPRIVAAFRRIGLSEQAGTGIRAFFGMRRRLGLVPPVIGNDRTRKAFQLTLVKEEILSEEQLRFQAKLGVHLDEAEAKTFAFACRHGRLQPRDVRAVTGLSGAGALAVLDRLTSRTLILPLEGTETPVFVLSEHLTERLGRAGQAEGPVGAGASGLVTDQAGHEPRRLVTDQPPISMGLDEMGWKIVAFCEVPRSTAKIVGELGLTHCTFFRRNHLEPLLAGGVLRMIHPDQPNHPHQACVLTEAGAALKAHGVKGNAGNGSGDRTNGA